MLTPAAVILAAAERTPVPSAPPAALDVVTIFWLGCALWLLWKFWLGWRAGVWRGLFALLAAVCALLAALVGGPWLGPLVRDVLALPEPAASWLAGGAAALVVYTVVSGVGRLLFKRTKDYVFPPTKLFVGTGGAACGLVGGLAQFWLLTLGLRLCGSVAAGHLAGRGNQTGGALERPLEALVEIKQSLESGISGQIVEWTDPIPPRTYRLFYKIAAVASDPEAVRRFSDAVVRQGAVPRDSPLARLADDPEIRKLFATKNYPALLREPRVAAALRDPQLRRRLERLDLERTLDEALGRNEPRKNAD